MAASDKPFRDQRNLDMVYAVSCIIMLLSTGWMLAQDYFREWRDEQYIFRKVEVAIAQRAALKLVPSEDEFKKADDLVAKKRAERELKDKQVADARAEMLKLQPQKEIAETGYQAVKARVDSITSFRDIAIEHRDTELASKYDDELKALRTDLAKAQAVRDDVAGKIKLEQLKIEEGESAFVEALAALKKVNDRFDTQVKLALSKRWGWGDWVRTMPVINGFADPLKLHQFTIEEIPIDYNFKKVSRFDRCMTCHLGIDRPAYTRANLEDLMNDYFHKEKLKSAEEQYSRRMIAMTGQKEAAMVPNPRDLQLVPLSKDVLTPARIIEFAAHPKLDLYVGANSKHPAEKFGCTSCHAGQGSGTSFTDASHSPNSAATRADWTKDRHWAPDHMWDFPMLPTRFIESSCLKCHHEVTDLISSDNRTEAPKVLRGYSLIKENGCFGCHEISGWKSGARVGPDLRLEHNPPLEDLNPIERVRVENDTDNRPGTLRKVGPALARVSEKTHIDFVRKWLLSPSSFRPDTKMPHYYGLSTNDPSVLPEEQKKFPNTEIASIAHYLMETSKQYVKNAQAHQKDDAAIRKADEDLVVDLLIKGRLNETDRKKLADAKLRIKLRGEKTLVDLAPKHAGDPKRGRVLFTERGCLACHTHQGTEKAQGTAADKGLFAPELKSDALFGPNLSQIAGKLIGKKSDTPDARKWLIQWLMNPQVHSPRSRMPVTHLEANDAADIAMWLIDEGTLGTGANWEDIKVDQPTMDELKKLAEVYLVRVLSKRDIERFFKGVSKEELDENGNFKDDSVKLLAKDVTEDEAVLFRKINEEGESALKHYLGKKAIGRLGCYGCHDIPGFETAKPVGVGLNDWGKKAADRLAFEDINNFFEKHYYPVKTLTGNDGIDKDGKQPYEEFYQLALTGHQPNREGYLNQKIRDPRSFDYNRIRTWDDRSRMPQFTLARPRKASDEDDAAFQGRKFKDEAAAREAVSTFVLGLVAEQVPLKSINQPKGDRLAEVKGRQVLDKFNCNGCHLIRPGIYDFKTGSKTMEKLEIAFKAQKGVMDDLGEFILKNHINWEGRNPIGDRTTAYGVRPTLRKGDDESYLALRLTEALRFLGTDKTVKNIPAGAGVSIALEDVTPEWTKIETQADLDRLLAPVQPYGGAFAELLVPWLNKQNDKKYPRTGDDAAARASLPPSLIGQGERTQADWLYQFLLNPQPVRRKAILRMPKFNMSNEEAKTLVDYFAGVTRQTNPGIGLQYPLETTPQRDELDSPYWRQKTADYIASLKKPIKGKDGKETTRYAERLAAFAPLWERIRKENEPAIEKLEGSIKTKTADKESKEKDLKDAKDDAKKAELKNKIDALDEEIGQLKKAKTQWDVDVQKASWHTKEAYAADAYRLLTSRELCTKCHQVGSFTAAELENQGPPLHLAAQRLRPAWVERWVNKPERFVPYQSLMPPYFSKNEKDLKYQQYHAGTSLEQLQALRDVLMNYPRISSLEVNRLYVPDAAPVEKK